MSGARASPAITIAAAVLARAHLDSPLRYSLRERAAGHRRIALLRAATAAANYELPPTQVALRGRVPKGVPPTPPHRICITTPTQTWLGRFRIAMILFLRLSLSLLFPTSRTTTRCAGDLSLVASLLMPTPRVSRRCSWALRGDSITRELSAPVCACAVYGFDRCEKLVLL